jgi:hypothetical protein
MKQIASVVFAFIVLNTAGFVVYRASSTSDAATVESAPSHIAPDPVASQPKPTGPIAPPNNEKQIVSAPTPGASVEEPSAPSPTQNLVENSRPALHTRPVKIPPRRVPQNAAVAPTSPKPVVEPPVVAPPPAVAPTPAATKPDDVINKMEANPYKRGE